MTKAELIKALEPYPDDMEVIYMNTITGEMMYLNITGLECINTIFVGELGLSKHYKDYAHGEERIVIY